MAFTIYLQFVMMIALVSGLFIMYEPILSSVAYENDMYDNAPAQLQAIRDALWNWGILIPVIGYSGSVFWFFKALQRQEVVGE